LRTSTTHIDASKKGSSEGFSQRKALTSAVPQGVRFYADHSPGSLRCINAGVYAVSVTARSAAEEDAVKVKIAANLSEEEHGKAAGLGRRRPMVPKKMVQVELWLADTAKTLRGWWLVVGGWLAGNKTS
jgi:hypothetical protein